jgi:DNA-binding MarR family transcriptional regulator
MINLLKRVMRSASATEANAWTILKHIADDKSCLVREVAARVSLSMEDTLAALSPLEQRAFARVSGNKGDVHARIVAITRRGRNEVTQAGVVQTRIQPGSGRKLGGAAELTAYAGRRQNMRILDAKLRD